MDLVNTSILVILEQKIKEYREILEKESPDVIEKALSFLEYRRELVKRGVNISFEDSLQKFDSDIKRIFEFMKQFALDIKNIFIQKGESLTHISDISPEHMEGGIIRKSFNRANNYETECGNWLFASSTPIDGNNLYLARKPKTGMIALREDTYIFGGDNMLVETDEQGQSHMYLREPNYIYRINPESFTPVVILKIDKEGKPYFEFSEEWISDKEININDKEQVLSIDTVSEITSILYNYQIFCDTQMQGIAKRIIATRDLSKGIELLNKYTEDGSLIYMNGISRTNVSPLIRSAYLKEWKEKILLEIKYHFEGEVESEIFEMIQNGEISSKVVDSVKEEKTQTKVNEYISKRGGIDKIVQARVLLVTTFDKVIESFRKSKELPYFEKKEILEPVLREFYQVIKDNYTDISSLWEYSEYLTMIREFSRVGTVYPFLEDIEHAKSEEEPEKTLDTLVTLVRDKVCKVEGGYQFHNTCVECQKTFNDVVGLNSGISNKSLDTQYNMGLPNYQHSFNLVKINNKFFIVDMSFVQFCDISFTPDVVGIPGMAGGNPGWYLMGDERKFEFLKGLIINGYFEATEENVKMYLDAFLLANRNSEFYRNHGKTNTGSTEISAKDYIKAIIEGRKLIFGKPEELGNLEKNIKNREVFEE